MKFTALKVALRWTAVRSGRLILRLRSEEFLLNRTPHIILAPHQDDETLGCGALIARLREQGIEVHVAFLTDGGASHPDRSIADLPAIRRREAEVALRHLQVDSTCIHFWNEPDGTLHRLTPENYRNLAQKLALLIGRVAPGRVIVPCSPDGSSEHDPVYGLALEGSRLAGRNPELWQYPIWCWWNPRLLFRRLFHTGRIGRLAAADYQVRKTDALQSYHSQLGSVGIAAAGPLPVELRDFCLLNPEYYFRSKTTKETPPST